MIPQTAAMIQMNAKTIANIQTITHKIAECDRHIQSCREARVIGDHTHATLSIFTVTHGSDSVTASVPDCPMMLDIIEIMHRRERQRLIDRLDEIGIVLTDQADLGPAPAWPKI
jgi:hypothetical protein